MIHYDIIGDLHGHYDELKALLVSMGYLQKEGVFQHPERTALFLGDFIDKGKQQRQVINTVRAMVDGCHAIAVMGNHEYNAVSLALTDAQGAPLRPHSTKNMKMHAAFHDAYPNNEERDEVAQWFKGLPVFLDLDQFRVVHAFWDDNALDTLKPYLNDNNSLTDEGYELANQKGHKVYKAVELVLKGPKAKLPKKLYFKDIYEIKRKKARVNWWVAPQNSLISRLQMGTKTADVKQLDKIKSIKSYAYGEAEKPLFFGHYRMKVSHPSIISHNLACLDLGVTCNKGGKLACYQWTFDHGVHLDNEQLTWVDKKPAKNKSKPVPLLSFGT